jgi:hypothetical protein
MGVRRVLLVVMLVAALGCWPVVAWAAGSQPERRTARGAIPAAAAVASVEADFNNDGFADLAVGVPREGVGAAELAGAVNVLYGSTTGLSGSGSQLFFQGGGGVTDVAEPFDSFGAALAAGDFDNDGFVDLAVGVPGEDLRAIPNAGAVNVLYGSTAGLSGAGGQFFSQDTTGVLGTAEPEDTFGAAVGTGDFDNDGFADLAIGVPAEDPGGAALAGAVNVLYGSAVKLTAAGNQQFVQGSGGVLGTAEIGDQFGFVLAAGDFNNDGFADLVIGAPFEDVGSVVDAGAINVLYGSAGRLSVSGDQVFFQGGGGVAGVAEASDFFGAALAGGDFDNDGLADLAIGAPFEDVGSVFDAGAVNVLYGSAAKLTATGDQQFVQGGGGVVGVAENGDFFGVALAGGDFDNDGFADLAIGAPFEDVGSVVDAGAINVLYGSAARLSVSGDQVFFQGGGGVAGVAEHGDFFGAALAGGDFDNDGFADLAIGAPFEDVGSVFDAGAINVLYGSAANLTATGDQQFFQGGGGVVGVAEPFDSFGAALAAGDFDNDGFADLAVGAVSEDIGATLDAGAVNVLYGSAARLTATGDQQFFQGNGGLIGVAEEGDFFGAALATGDYDNDSFADLAVGVPFEDVIGVLDAGAVNVLYGSAGRLSGAGNQQFFQGNGGVLGTREEGDAFGSSLA